MFKPAQALVIEAKKSVKESPIEEIEKAITDPQKLIVVKQGVNIP